MSRHHSVLSAAASRVAIVLLVAFGLAACAASPPQDTVLDCKCKGSKVKVDVTEVNGMPAVNPDPVMAREGDQVHWVFHGSAAREFAIVFQSAQDSPFDWSEMKGAQVKACVKAGAARDGSPTDYEYDVDINGRVLDPKIIIER